MQILATDIIAGNVTGHNTNTTTINILCDQSNLYKFLNHEYVKFITKYG